MHSKYPQEPALPDPARASRGGMRLRGLLIAAPCWGVLLVAALLRPQADGYGTHEQLDLPTCSFLVKTGYPCPSCGMTTSVSAMAHGRAWSAFLAQPFGVFLAVALLVVGAAGAAELVTGRAAVQRLRPGLWWVWTAVGGMLGGWAVKVLLGLARGELPIR